MSVDLKPYLLDASDRSNRLRSFPTANYWVKSIDMSRYMISSDNIKANLEHEILMTSLLGIKKLSFTVPLIRVYVYNNDTASGDDIDRWMLGNSMPNLVDITGILINKNQIKQYTTNTLYFITEKMDGNCKTLIDKILNIGDQNLVKQFFLKTAELFITAYSSKFYHGDPKPHNILYKQVGGSNYKLYFTDFEYSCFLDNLLETKTIEYEYESQAWDSKDFKNSFGSRYYAPRLALKGYYNYSTNMYKGFAAYKDNAFENYTRASVIDFITFVGFFLLYYSVLLNYPVIYRALVNTYTRFVATSNEDSKSRHVPKQLYSRISPNYFITMLQ